jgi:hypothetical protein
VELSQGKVGMVQLTIDMPEGALSSLRQDPVNFVRELRLAAAVKWYEMRRVSQGRAAEIAGFLVASSLPPWGNLAYPLPI